MQFDGFKSRFGLNCEIVTLAAKRCQVIPTVTLILPGAGTAPRSC